jgi:hypothetical protein
LQFGAGTSSIGLAARIFALNMQSKATPNALFPALPSYRRGLGNLKKNFEEKGILQCRRMVFQAHYSI